MYAGGKPRRLVLIGTVVGALALGACSSSNSGGTTDNGNASTTQGAQTQSTPATSGASSGNGSAGFTMTMEQELANAGQTDSTAFCGTKQITLGIEDGVGNNAWSVASMAAVRSEAAKCPNVKQVALIGEGDLQKSISQLNTLTAQGANAIVVIPDFGQAELPAIRAATDAGVKVVPWAADPSGTAGKDYVAYVDWSSPDAGTLWAEWMVKALNGNGNVIFLGGPAGNPVTEGQLKSIVAVFAKNPGMHLLTGNDKWAVDNWDPGQTQQVTASLLTKYPQIDGIISDYGSSTYAALRAFQTANRPLVPVATLDTNGLGCLYQEEKGKGKFELMTISSRNWLGRVAARTAIAAAQGIQHSEPSKYQLPAIEDTLNGLAPVCDKSAPADSYNSSKLSADVLAKYGTTK